MRRVRELWGAGSLTGQLRWGAAWLVLGTGAAVIALFVGLLALTPTYTVPRSPVPTPGSVVAPPVQPGEQEEVPPQAALGDLNNVVSSTHDLRQFTLVAVLGSTLIIAIAAVIGANLLARKITGSLREITAAARQAAGGRLDRRVHYAHQHTEIAEVAETFNAMLDSLERLVAARSHFAASASHELRTPLATTRAMLDAAELSGRAPSPELLRRIAEMNGRMIETVDALFALARAEHLGAVVEAVPLAALVEELTAEVLGDSELQLCSELAEVTVSGDPRLLRQLVRNLLENARRHNIADGWIELRLSATPTPTLAVRNSTHALHEHPELLAEPFRRPDARTRSGLGLGLAIAAAAARAHDATLELSQPQPGTFYAELRCASPAEECGSPLERCAERGVSSAEVRSVASHAMTSGPMVPGSER